MAAHAAGYGLQPPAGAHNWLLLLLIFSAVCTVSTLLLAAKVAAVCSMDVGQFAVTTNFSTTQVLQLLCIRSYCLLPLWLVSAAWH